MPTPRHKWANDGSEDFEYLDTVHGKKGVNPVQDDGQWDAEADGQEYYNARGRPDLSDEAAEM